MGKTDAEHLRILSIMHYIFGALKVLGGISGLVLLLLGGALVSGAIPPDSPNDQAAVQAMGVLFSAIGMGITLFCLLSGAAIAAVGYCLTRRQAYAFCLVVAGSECLSFPLGTVLGVFTIVVLMRDSVKAAFAAGAP